MKQRRATAVWEPTTRAANAAVEIGWLTSGSTPSAPVVEYRGNPHGPLLARTTVPLDERTLDDAVRTGRGVVLQFEGGRADLPIVTGLLVEEGSAAAPTEIEARVDGRRVAIRAEDEIVLSCGAASITLTRDGKVLVRGAYVETHSRGVNRIKGGAVRIN